MYCRQFLITVIVCLFFVGKLSARFVLMIMLYNETNVQRMQEYVYCLEQNKKNPYIQDIHVFYDNTKDDTNNQLLTYLKSRNVVIDYIHGRASFGDLFDVANILYPNEKIIISNADIYFDKTLGILNRYDLSNTFLALSRWEITKDERIGPLQLCQDTWIFQAPIYCSRAHEIYLGTYYCETIAYYVMCSGRQIINPCLSIKCYHMHISAIRHYNPAIDFCPINHSFKLPMGEMHEIYKKMGEVSNVLKNKKKYVSIMYTYHKKLQQLHKNNKSIKG